MKNQGKDVKEKMVGRIKELYAGGKKVTNEVDPMNYMLIRGFDRINKGVLHNNDTTRYILE